ncbi:hypothetical protein [Pantoea sp. 1.19]|uniref:hypothetical protein n=1 Tax=Pantoea sp. 1.19 TaxID=1925589 RepID=UPI00147EE0AA|nr:hypothetical protein [Pantoea sp. 1.19]
MNLKKRKSGEFLRFFMSDFYSFLYCCVQALPTKLAVSMMVVVAPAVSTPAATAVVTAIDDTAIQHEDDRQ